MSQDQLTSMIPVHLPSCRAGLSFPYAVPVWTALVPYRSEPPISRSSTHSFNIEGREASLLCTSYQSVIKQLKTRIKETQQALSCLPEGVLHTSHQGNQYYYRHKLTDGTIRYIPKKDLSLACDLAYRKYLELQLEELQERLRAMLSFQHATEHSRGKAVQYLEDNEGAGRLLRERLTIENAPLSEWASRPPCISAPYQERCIFTCRSGHTVRSKSEVMIDNALYTARIPFRYEDPLTLGNQVLHPDFTIRHPVSGAYILWEHFGLMDVPKYIRSATEKTALYACHGYTPFHNLILTYETDDRPLTYSQIDLMLFYYFQI